MRASIRKWAVLLISVLLIGSHPAIAVVLTWDPPTTNADGSPLTDLAYYRIYHAPLGTNYGPPLKTGAVSSASVGGLTPGLTYRFQVSAVDTSENESLLSAAVEYTAPADTTPPTTSNLSVPDGATEIDPNVTLTATFSEAINPATVTSQTVLLFDATGQPVPATVSYNASTRQVTLNPTSALAPGTTYTWMIDGVTDIAGNRLVPFSVDFTTAASPAWNCPCRLWSATDIPLNPSASDWAAVELGLKFQAAVAGLITGVRYYKSAQNTGTHLAKIWTRTGQLLKSATFPSSQNTGTGWKQVTFGTPLPIQPNTTYIVSYHAPFGHYAWQHQYFITARTVGPLTALASGTDGGNGVYRYGSSAFPTQTWQQSNYFVDLIFVPQP